MCGRCLLQRRRSATQGGWILVTILSTQISWMETYNDMMYSLLQHCAHKYLGFKLALGTMATALRPIHFFQIDRARTDTGSGLRYKERSKVIWIHPKVKIQKECKEDFSPFWITRRETKFIGFTVFDIKDITHYIMVDAEHWINHRDESSCLGSGRYGWCDRSVSSRRQPKGKAIL